MLRLIAALLLVAAPSWAGDDPQFHPARSFPSLGAGRAQGAVVWLHGGVSPGQFITPDYPDGQPAPPWLARFPALGWDVWRLDRTPGHDPLAEGEARLVAGLVALHTEGYRRVIVAGFSRGAFIAMAALARPDLVEAVILLSPAAHGPRAERRAQALADFASRLDRAKGPLRFALVQLADDPFDLAPAERGAMARDAAQRAGLGFRHIDRPAMPTGHMGAFEPEFDAQFGESLARFALGAPQQ